MEGPKPSHDSNFTQVLPDGGRAVQVMRLKEGMERFMITDINNPSAANKAQSEVAVMWDTSRSDYNDSTKWDPRDFNHPPGGANVLFMDGHVEFGKYPQPEGSKFWMLTTTIQSDGFYHFP